MAHTERLKKLADWLTAYDGLIKFDLGTWQSDALYYCVKVWENDWTWNNALMPVLQMYENTKSEEYVKLSAVEWFEIETDAYQELFFPGAQTMKGLKELKIAATPCDVAHNIYAFIQLTTQPS